LGYLNAQAVVFQLIMAGHIFIVTIQVNAMMSLSIATFTKQNFVNGEQMKICKIDGCTKPVRSMKMCVSHYSKLRRHGDPLAGRASPGSAAAWLHQHINYQGSECLIWPFGKPEGYGKIWISGKLQIVSRLMCEYRHGPPPTQKHQAAHSCGNGHLACVNPRHLRWATRKENEGDKIIHGTHNRGERHGQSKLTESIVLEIRAIKGLSQQAIASRYGVSRFAIGRIKNKGAWKHVL
jgi:hypothetical protein